MSTETVSTPKARPRIQSLKILSEMMLSPRTLVVALEDGEIEIVLRGLTSDQAAECDKLPAPVPPLKQRPDPRIAGKTIEGDYDFEDAGYLEKRRHYASLMRTSIIALGLVDIEVPGADIEEKNCWLRANLPPRVLDLLDDKIRSLTGNAITKASFSSASASTASQS